MFDLLSLSNGPTGTAENTEKWGKGGRGWLVLETLCNEDGDANKDVKNNSKYNK